MSVEDLGRRDDWSGVRAVVAGFGVSGFAAADNLTHLGAQVTALADGRILVAGGTVGPPRDMAKAEIVRSSEIYDPRSNTWSAGPELREIRTDGQAITLDDGSVLVLGGVNRLNVGGDTPFCVENLRSVERLTPAP